MGKQTQDRRRDETPNVRSAIAPEQREVLNEAGNADELCEDAQAPRSLEPARLERCSGRRPRSGTARAGT
jgi:hypothetical protein